jgi:hypothetical protein
MYKGQRENLDVWNYFLQSHTCLTKASKPTTCGGIES